MLDVGWYPEFDPKGCFIIQIIQDDDWLSPILKLKSKNLNTLKKAIEKGCFIANIKKDDKNIPFRTVEYESYE